jgi:hypothetical protein
LDWGLDVAWTFGIKDSHEIEAYGNGLKVIGEVKLKEAPGPIITVSINATD